MASSDDLSLRCRYRLKDRRRAVRRERARIRQSEASVATARGDEQHVERRATTILELHRACRRMSPNI